MGLRTAEGVGQMAFITAAEAAILIALNLHRRGEQNGRELKRVRISDKTLREITGRRRVEARFLEDLSEELLELGWLVVRTHSAWGFLRASAVMGWPRVNSSRISNELGQISAGNLQTVIKQAQDEIAMAQGEVEDNSDTEPSVSLENQRGVSDEVVAA
jgi:hypothetical protein